MAIYCPSMTSGRLHQGENISGLVQMKMNVSSLAASEGQVADFVIHPYAIIASQDCDLEQDFELHQSGHAPALGQQLPSILFCEVGEADKVRVGPPNLKSDIWRRVKTNKDERYQFLQKVDPDQDSDGVGIPALSVDFKRYFTIPNGEVYFRIKAEAKRRCVLQGPYLEHFMCRFFHFQLRVALPAEHDGD